MYTVGFSLGVIVGGFQCTSLSRPMLLTKPAEGCWRPPKFPIEAIFFFAGPVLLWAALSCSVGDFSLAGITGHSAILCPSTLQYLHRMKGHSSLKWLFLSHDQHSSRGGCFPAPMSESFLLQDRTSERVFSFFRALLDLYSVHGPYLFLLLAQAFQKRLHLPARVCGFRVDGHGLHRRGLSGWLTSCTLHRRASRLWPRLTSSSDNAWGSFHHHYYRARLSFPCPTRTK